MSESTCDACELTRRGGLSIGEFVTAVEQAHERHHALLRAEKERVEFLGHNAEVAGRIIATALDERDAARREVELLMDEIEAHLCPEDREGCIGVVSWHDGPRWCGHAMSILGGRINPIDARRVRGRKEGP